MTDSTPAALSDADLTAQANDFAQRLSYYYAGWDFRGTAQRERDAQSALERESLATFDEMRQRGLALTVSALFTL